MTLTPALIAAYKARRAANNRLSATYALHLARTDRMPSLIRTPAPVLGHGDCIRFRDKSGQRQTAVVAIVPDSDMGAPWEEHDGHGVVSDWTRRDKRPGEIVLNSDHGSHRFYDLGATIQRAKADSWGLDPVALAKLTDKLGHAPTSGQVREAAVRADFERLQGWCNDSWHWVGVCLFLLPRDGLERDPSHIADVAPFGILPHAALWGIESDSPEYHAEVARELTAELA